MKARYCDECKHRTRFITAWSGCVCEKNHRPRWYKPKSSLDVDWGWKRRCEDFEEKTK